MRITRDGSLAKSGAFLAWGRSLLRDFQPRVFRGTDPGSDARKSDKHGDCRHGIGTARAFQRAQSQKPRQGRGGATATTPPPARRGLRLARIWLAVGLRGLVFGFWWLLRALGRLLWFRVLPFSGRALGRGAVASWRGFPGFVLAFRWVILGAFVGILGWLASVEMRTSHLQAWLFSRLDQGHGLHGRSRGPPERRAFRRPDPMTSGSAISSCPAFISSLVAHRYGVDAQARWSPGLERFVGLGAFPIYREKDKAGLRIFDRGGEQIYGVQFPERTYPDYASMPQLAVRSLLVHRGPLPVRRAQSRAQSGDRVEPLRAGGGRRGSPRWWSPGCTRAAAARSPPRSRNSAIRRTA